MPEYIIVETKSDLRNIQKPTIQKTLTLKKNMLKNIERPTLNQKERPHVNVEQ